MYGESIDFKFGLRSNPYTLFVIVFLLFFNTSFASTNEAKQNQQNSCTAILAGDKINQIIESIDKDNAEEKISDINSLKNGKERFFLLNRILKLKNGEYIVDQILGQINLDSRHRVQIANKIINLIAEKNQAIGKFNLMSYSLEKDEFRSLLLEVSILIKADEIEYRRESKIIEYYFHKDIDWETTMDLIRDQPLSLQKKTWNLLPSLNLSPQQIIEVVQSFVIEEDSISKGVISLLNLPDKEEWQLAVLLGPREVVRYHSEFSSNFPWNDLMLYFIDNSSFEGEIRSFASKLYERRSDMGLIDSTLNKLFVTFLPKVKEENFFARALFKPEDSFIPGVFNRSKGASRQNNFEQLLLLIPEELGEGVLEHIGHFQFSPSEKKIFIEASIGQRPELSAEYFRLFGVSEERERFEYFKALFLANQSVALERWLNFDLHTHAFRAAKLLAQSGASAALEMLDVNSTEAQKNEILNILIANGNKSIISEVDTLEMSPRNEFKVARKFLEDGNAYELIVNIRSFNLKPREMKALLGRAVPLLGSVKLSESKISRLLSRLSSNKILGEYSFAISMEILKANPTDAVYRKVLKLTNFTEQQKHKLLLPVFLLNPIPVLQGAGYEVNEHTPADDPSLDIDMRRALMRFAGSHPEVLSKKIVDVLWKDFKNLNVGLGLMSQVYHHSNYSLDHLDVSGGEYGILFRGLGLDVSQIQFFKKLSSDRKQRFFAAAIDLGKAILEISPFQEIKFINDLWIKKNISVFTELILITRDFISISDDKLGAWLKVKNMLKESPQPVDVDTINEGIKIIKNQILDQIKLLFNDANIQLTWGQLQEMNTRWGGNISNIYRLLARYRGNDSWKSQVPLLAKVFEAESKQEFEAFKYHGFGSSEHGIAQATRQLEVLGTPARVDLWKAARYEISIFDPSNSGAEGSEALLFTALEDTYSSQLLPHLGLEESELTNYKNDEIIEQILSARKDPRDVLDQLNETFHDSSVSKKDINQHIVKTVIERLIRDNGLPNSNKLIRFLLINKSALNFSVQTEADLTSLASITKTSDKKGGKEQIIITTTVDDARSLLEIGDIVFKCGSCQNFDTGGHIQTLLGYVVDANVKAVVSFSLSSEHFKDAKSFETVKNSYEAGKLLNVNFEGAERRFNFEIDGISESIYSNSIDYAHRRRMLKLGVTDGGLAGIFMVA